MPIYTCKPNAWFVIIFMLMFSSIVIGVSFVFSMVFDMIGIFLLLLLLFVVINIVGIKEITKQSCTVYQDKLVYQAFRYTLEIPFSTLRSLEVVEVQYPKEAKTTNYYFDFETRSDEFRRNMTFYQKADRESILAFIKEHCPHVTLTHVSLTR